MTEYKYGNITVRIHGEPPKREKIEKSCVRFVNEVEKKVRNEKSSN